MLALHSGERFGGLVGYVSPCRSQRSPGLIDIESLQHHIHSVALWEIAGRQ